MTIAAKHFDPQLGIDIHLYLIPPSPIPIPLPTPHIGIVLDPFDYIPVIGGTVNVNGIKRATAGSMGLDVHIPVGGVWMPTMRMPMGPQWDDELFMGSKTVLADGEPFARVGMPVLACNIVGMIAPLRPKKPKKPHLSLLLPTTINLAIPTNVFVGGPPTVSWWSLGIGLGLAGLGKVLKKTGIAGRAADAFRKVRQKLFKHLPPGFLKCNVLRAEPVDIRDGSVSVTHEDFAIPGRLPLVWTRNYRSTNDHVGACGHGWQTPADLRLEIEPDGTVLLVDASSMAVFPHLPRAIGEEHAVLELIDGARLSRRQDTDGDWLQVQGKNGLCHVFPYRASNVVQLQTRRIEIERIEDRCGHHWRFEREDGRLIRIAESGIDGLQGRFIEVESRHGRIDRMDLHDPATALNHALVRYEYSDEGDLIAVVDALEAARTFEYRSHRMLRHTDRVGLSFYYGYDRHWRVVHAWGDGGLHDTKFRYDQVLNETEITDSLGQVSTVKFDANGLPLCEIDPLDGVTVFEYDDVGRTTAVVDPMGLRTEFEYDERGNLQAFSRPDGNTLRIAYDQRDLPVAFTDPSGGTWTQRWDSRGLLLEHVTPLGAVSRCEYDTAGQLRGHVNPRGAASRIEFDRYGLVCAITDALGGLTRYEHDALGRLCRRIDAADHATGYRYDAKGRVLEVRHSNGATVYCEYDAEGQLTHHRDESGALTRLDHSGIGQIARRIQPDGHGVRYEYDTEEQLVAVVNQRGERYEFRRDPLGRVVEEIDYWGQSRRYDYDAAGRIRRSIDPLGRTITFETDALGRITRKATPDAADPSLQVHEHFRYDRVGNVVELRNTISHVTRSFDLEGRLTREVQNGFAIAHIYDVAGNRVQRTTDAGNTVIVEYDLLDRPSAIAINDAAPIVIGRNVLGQVSIERLSSALTRLLDYSDEGQIAAQLVLKGEEPLFGTAFEYDQANNLVHREDSHHGDDRYTYDPMGRLMERIDPASKVTTWLSDPAGDRLRTRIRQVEARQVAGGGSEAFAGWSREGGCDGMRYVFDRAGNLSERHHEREPGRPVLRLAWDANQRLTGSTWSGGERDGERTRYGYDPWGRRVFKRGPASTTWFFWDGDALLAEVEQSHGDAADASEPLYSGQVVDLLEARKRLHGLKALHPKAREYVYRPGTFEPLALVEDRLESVVEDVPTSSVAPVPAPAPASDAVATKTNAVLNEVGETPERPRAEAMATPMHPATTMPESSAPVAAPPTSSWPASSSQGLGFGITLGQSGTNLASHPIERDAPLPSLALGAGLALSDTSRTSVSAVEHRGPVAMASTSMPPRPIAERARDTLAHTKAASPPEKPARRYRSIYYFHNDPNSCPVRITDADGRLLWSAGHEPWGRLEHGDAVSIANPIRLQGQYVDNETGLHYNLQRYYDPRIGSYISADPIGLAGGVNPYLYANGNPLSWVDPWGLAACRRGEWIFPDGGSHNLNDYQEVRTNGIRGDRDEIVRIVNQTRQPAYFNHSSAGGLGDILESGIQRLFRGRNAGMDPLTAGFAERFRGVDHPMRVIAHSQGTLTAANAARRGLLPPGSTFDLRSPALSRRSAQRAVDVNGGTLIYDQPDGDIANLYTTINPRRLGGVIRNFKQSVNIHTDNGLQRGLDLPDD